MLCAIFSHFSPITMFTQLQIQLSQHAFLDGIDGDRRTLKKSQKNERNSQKLVQYIGEVQLCLENILKKSLKFNLFQFPKRNSATQTFSPKCSRNSKKMRKKQKNCFWGFYVTGIHVNDIPNVSPSQKYFPIHATSDLIPLPRFFQ